MPAPASLVGEVELAGKGIGVPLKVHRKELRGGREGGSRGGWVSGWAGVKPWRAGGQEGTRAIGSQRHLCSSKLLSTVFKLRLFPTHPPTHPP